jgi:ABC-type transport system involved in cytochrome c biogenesis ATPase subunit
MLYGEIIAVCSQIHTKHINTVCWQNIELLNVKSDCTYGNHLALQLKSQCTVMEHLIFLCENYDTNDRRMESNGSIVHGT